MDGQWQRKRARCPRKKHAARRGASFLRTNGGVAAQRLERQPSRRHELGRTKQRQAGPRFRVPLDLVQRYWDFRVIVACGISAASPGILGLIFPKWNNDLGRMSREIVNISFFQVTKHRILYVYNMGTAVIKMYAGSPFHVTNAFEPARDQANRPGRAHVHRFARTRLARRPVLVRWKGQAQQPRLDPATPCRCDLEAASARSEKSSTIGTTHCGYLHNSPA